MNTNSRDSNSNLFAHNIVIHWSLFKLWIESLHNHSHQGETIYDKSIFFENLVRQWKSKEWATFELRHLLLIFIHLTQNVKSLVKMPTLNANTRPHIPNRNHPKFSTLHLPFCLLVSRKSQTEWLSWVLWDLLLLMKPSYTLQKF